MADKEIQEVTTSFSDITTLGQGYVDRVDGQQIMLPLSSEVQPGEGVRYVVFLADGTPAFAGAGRCVRVNDAGDERYETLIDTLQFDERSQPVYDYLVAVRTATYGEGAPEPSAESEAGGAAASEAPTSEVSTDDGDLGMDDEETVYTGGASAQDAGDVSSEAEYAADGGEADAEAVAVEEEADDAAAFAPDNIPRGILTRPALGLQWRPARPQRPTGRPPGSMFQYEFGPLPSPAGPPRPDLDPSLWISRAPRPAAEPAQAESAPPESAPPESAPPESAAPESMPPETMPPSPYEASDFTDESVPPDAPAPEVSAGESDADESDADEDAPESQRPRAQGEEGDDPAEVAEPQEDPWAE
jgi:hypothetical protein